MSQDSFTKPSGASKLSVSNFTNSFEIIEINFCIVVTYGTTVKHPKYLIWTDNCAETSAMFIKS